MDKKSYTVIDLSKNSGKNVVVNFSSSNVKEIIVDLDSVVFDFGGILEHVVRKEYPDFSMNNVVTYDFNKFIDKIPVTALGSRYKSSDVEKYIQTSDGYYLLKADRSYIMNELANPVLYTDAEPFVGVESLKLLMDSPEYEVIFNTAVPHENTDIIVQAKMDKLKGLFDGHCYGFVYTVGVEKPIWKSAYAIIDDKLEYLCIQADAQCKAKLCLIDQPYNQLEYNVFANKHRFRLERSSSVGDVVEKLLKEEL